MPYARCPRNAIYTTTSGAQIIKNIKEYKNVTAGKDIQENEDIRKYKDKKEYRENVYRLSSYTCLAGDIIGDYKFDSKINIGEQACI